MLKIPLVWLFFSLFLLAGCGGGGGSSSSAAPVASQQPSTNISQVSTNSAPTLSGEKSFTVIEGQIRVSDLVATDPEGEAVSLFLSGEDSEYFSISATGRLSFLSVSDFDFFNFEIPN